MSYEFCTVKGEKENLIVIERSKFICNIKGVENEEEAKEFIDLIRKKHSLATHNCYAYIADDKGLVQKFSDDGEPQGTAGLPMLEVLKNKRIFCIFLKFSKNLFCSRCGGCAASGACCYFNVTTVTPFSPSP